MPRIDPVQLLKCLSVLLDNNGGIKSQDEVQRLASLMTKFSKKLVSKCIYIHILKQTKTDLLGLFMGAGGWTLTHVWLTEGILAKNGALVKELLELLLVCPVDVDRLKSNNCPKLVKDLSKDGSVEVVRTLASKLVEQWLKIVKGETTLPLTLSEVTEILSPTETIAEEFEQTVSENQKEANGTDDVDQSPEVSVPPESGDFEFISVNEGDVNDSSIVDDSAKTVQAIPILKISVKDGKQVVSKVNEPISDKKSNDSDKITSDKIVTESKKDDRTTSKDKNRDKDKSSSTSSSSSSKSSSGKSSSGKYSRSHSDNHKNSNNHSSSKLKDNSSSKSKKTSKDSKHLEKQKDKDSDNYKEKDVSKLKHSDKHKDKNVEKSKDRDADRHKASDKSKSKDSERHSKHRSSSDKHKEKDAKVREQSEKNKETLQKLQPVSLNKLGKIPKKTPIDDSRPETKEKLSISIEVRKPNDTNRPKTVKMFNSKFRSHGLEEEAKRPPPRGMIKKSSAPLAAPVVLPSPKRSSPPPPSKRSSPPPVHEVPPEKKLKVTEHVDKPGAIKLIPPKPKPAYLLESDMFMDALTASASNKKEPKKRKRRISGSKDGAPAGDASPPPTPTTPTTPPVPTDVSEDEKSSAPPRFYQDTLETEEDNKANENVKEEIKEEPPKRAQIVVSNKEIPKNDKEESIPNEVQSPDHLMDINPPSLKGVLLYHKRTGPKKTLRWRPEGELEEIQYFELDENERVNVTKTFTDLIHLDRVQERENFKKSRNLSNEDLMEEKMTWRSLIVVDSDATYVEYGKSSKEKDIQAAREKSILPALYFHKSVIPESPFEPDAENHPTTDPVIIPLEDVTGNLDSINDYRNTPWPEPKLTPQPMPTGMPMPPMFPTMPQFPPGFPPNPPFGIPGFPPNPAMLAGDWTNGPPGMMMPPEAMNMGPDMFPGNGQMFPGPMPPNGFGMMENMNGPMFPQRFPAPVPGIPVMPMGVVPNGPNGSFNVMNNNNSNIRGNIRNMGPRHQNPHWRQKAPVNWSGPPRGGSARGRLCTYFQKSGFCRQGDNCHFVHSGVNNAPY